MRTQQTLATTVAALLAAGAMAFPSQSSPYTGVVQRSHPNRGRRAADGKGIFMMNRIAPATSEIYVANADGTGETLLLGNNSAFDYHASWSPDGQWVTFTSERNGDGQADVFRARADGSGVEAVLATPSFEDKLVLSPDGTQGAYVSTAGGYTANIWVVDLATGAARNLTDTALARTSVDNDESPRGHFSPAWSPDGQWIAFSSDRETAWTGHSNGSGWEHTQSLSIYAIKPDGTGFRQVATNGSDMSCEYDSFYFVPAFLLVFVTSFTLHSSFVSGTWCTCVSGGDMFNVRCTWMHRSLASLVETSERMAQWNVSFSQLVCPLA